MSNTNEQAKSQVIDLEKGLGGNLIPKRAENIGYIGVPPKGMKFSA